MLLTIIIPCYNEKKTIIQILKKIRKQKQIKKQIILVDDFSTDGTRIIIKQNSKNIDKVIFHKQNSGKGSSIISALKYIKGDLVLIQDADLEYDPRDYNKLIKPFENKAIQIVYGSRFLGKSKKNNFINSFRIVGNYFLTFISNLINNQKLTDAHTCYKVFRKKTLLSLKLKEKRFAFCPEVTTKSSNLGIEILEVPIKYKGRGVSQGKKIALSDAFDALFVILKNKIFKNL